MKRLNQSAVYWIHLPEHTDIHTQGYVGVSKNPLFRWSQHQRAIEGKSHSNRHLSLAVNKYGWNNLIKETVLYGEEDYCYLIENDFRPQKNIGWNIAPGGGKPPSSSYTDEELEEYLNSEEYKEYEWCCQQGLKDEAERNSRAEEIKQAEYQRALRYYHVKSIFKWIEEYYDE